MKKKTLQYLQSYKNVIKAGIPNKIHTFLLVEVRSTLTSQGFLKGGVFYNETYIYQSTRFFWSNNNTKIVEHAINGVG